ncbi:MAG: hypothetical protein WD795_05005 [Woeseia sp.]
MGAEILNVTGGVLTLKVSGRLTQAELTTAEDSSPFTEFPPSQKAGSFSLDQVMETLQTAPKGGN